MTEEQSPELRHAVRMGIVLALAICSLLGLLAFDALADSLPFEQVVVGDKVGQDVKGDFQFGTLRVSPETATSANRNFQQTYTYTSNHPDKLFYFFAFYMNDSLQEMRINTSSQFTLQQMKKGSTEYYFNKQGIQIEKDKSQAVTLNYTSKNDQGKFYAAIFANSLDDWTCVLSQSCEFFYAIDPTYISIANGSSTGNSDIGESSTFGLHVAQEANVTCGTATCRINDVIVALAKQGTPTDSVRMNATLGAGMPQPSSANLIENSSIIVIDAANITTTAVNYTANFSSTQFIVANGTPFFFIFERTGAVDASNYVQVAHSSSVPAGSRACQKDGTSSTWPNQTHVCSIQLYVSDVSASGAAANDTINFNYTFSNNVFETSTNEFVFNFSSVGENVSLHNLTLNFNNTPFALSLRASGGSGNASFQTYNFSYLRAPIVSTNGTAIPFNFTFNYTTTNNGSNFSNTTVADAQNTLWAFFPSILTTTSSLLETQLQNITVNYSFLGNTSSVSFVLNAQHNTTNRSLSLLHNGTTSETYQAGFLTSLVGSANVTVNVSAWLNLTFNGMTLTRNNTAYQEQIIYQALLENCTQGTTTTRALNVTIVDVNGTSINASSATLNITVWTSNDTLNRTHTLNFTSNSTPAACIYPTNATFNSTLTIQTINTGFEDLNVTASPTLSGTSQEYQINLTARTNVIVSGGGGGSALTPVTPFSPLSIAHALSFQDTKTCFTFSKAPKCSMIVSSNKPIKAVNTSFEIERGINVLNVITLIFHGNSHDFYQERAGNIIIDDTEKTITMQIYNFNTPPAFVGLAIILAIIALALAAKFK